VIIALTAFCIIHRNQKQNEIKQYFIGLNEAPVSIVVYCGFFDIYCEKTHSNYPQIRDNYIVAGKVKYSFIYIPKTWNDKEGEKDIKVAEALECAGMQWKYKEMYEKIIQRNATIEMDELKQIGIEIGVDQGKFNKCLTEGLAADSVLGKISRSHEMNITYFPITFLNKEKIEGFISYDSLSKKINSLLGDN